MRALVIDDSATMRSMHAAVLRQLGFPAIAEAGTGFEGLNKAREFPPDVVLVDGIMPEMDGLGFVRAYREIAANVPIVMVTEDCGATHAIEAINAGVDAYLVKPFTPDLLAQRIEEAIESSDNRARVPNEEVAAHAA